MPNSENMENGNGKLVFGQGMQPIHLEVREVRSDGRTKQEGIGSQTDDNFADGGRQRNSMVSWTEECYILEELEHEGGT